MELRLLREWVGGQSHEGYGLMVSKLRIALDGSHALGILVCTCMAMSCHGWTDEPAAFAAWHVVGNLAMKGIESCCGQFS